MSKDGICPAQVFFSENHKMVPMFSLSHGFTNKWTDPALYTYLIELAVTILSYWVHLPTIRAVGLLLLFIGYGFFALDMKEILAKRVKKKLDKPFSFSITAIWNGLILHFIAFLAALFNLNSESRLGRDHLSLYDDMDYFQHVGLFI